MSQQQPKLYTRTKRDEMTFGILPEFVPTDLVGNMKGDARIYSSLEVHDLMMQMDEGFVGMRRSLVDKLENMRQLILYTPIGTIDENDTVRFAVYQRAAGSEARLKDGFSIGFGGHVEREDLHGHYAHNEEGQYVEIPDVPSSFYSTLNSGMRELAEEVLLFNKGDVERPMTVEEMLADLARGFGFPGSMEFVQVQSFTPAITEGALINTPAAILQRSDEDGSAILYGLENGPSLEEIYAMLAQRQPVHTVDPADVNGNVVPFGFVSDRDMDKPGFVGNTHLGVLAMLRVKSDIDFKVLEEKYTTVGWKTKEELLELRPRCEPWTQYLLEHIDAMEHILRTECRVDARPEEPAVLEG